MLRERQKICHSVQPHLLDTILDHTLETLLISIMNLRNLETVLPQLLHQLPSIKHTIRPPSLNNQTLLFQREILPLKLRTNNLFEQTQYLIMRYSARVCEIVNTGFVIFGEQDGGGEEIVEDGVAVWDVDHAFVFCDFRDEVAGVEVIGDGHAEAEAEDVGVVHHNLCREQSQRLCFGSMVGHPSYLLDSGFGGRVE